MLEPESSLAKTLRETYYFTVADFAALRESFLSIMSLYSTILLPIFLGLIGFVDPLMAINWLAAGSTCKRQQQEMMKHQLFYIAELR